MKLTEIKLTEMELYELANAICIYVDSHSYYNNKRCNAMNRVVNKIIKASQKAESTKQLYDSGIMQKQKA
jgi:hypothetical protein